MRLQYLRKNGTRLADRVGGADMPEMRGARVQIAALGATANDPVHGVERGERGSGGGGVVAFESLMKATPARSVTRSMRCGRPGK
jgi:hypothetical protein